MYKLGDRVRSEDKLHGHDSRIIHGVIGAIDTTKVGTSDDPFYRIDWNGGGCDWLMAEEFEPDYEEVYVSHAHWDVASGTWKGDIIVGLYRSLNIPKMIDDMVRKLVEVAHLNIDRSLINSRTNNDGNLEITYSARGVTIIGFVSKMPIKEE